MHVRFSNIKWDTSDDGEQSEVSPEDLGLPTEVVLECDDDCNLDTEGADVLSDRYGFCVFSFDYEVVRRFRVEAIEKFYVRTTYMDVWAADAVQAEARCKSGKEGYDKSSNEEGDEEWIETVSVQEQ